MKPYSIWYVHTEDSVYQAVRNGVRFHSEEDALRAADSWVDLYGRTAHVFKVTTERIDRER